MQPATQAVRTLGRLACTRQYSLQCKNGLGSQLFTKQSRSLILFKRQLQHPTEKNVIMSTYPPLEVPNCTLSEYIWKDVEKWSEKTAVVSGITGRGYTYMQAYKMSNAFAASLRNKLGVRDGDRIAVMIPNCPEFPLVALGCIQAGAIATTVNPIYTSEEVAIQLTNSGAKIIVTSADCCEIVQKAINMTGKSIPVIVAECDTGLSHPDGTIKFSDLAENFSQNTDCLKEVRRTADDVVFLPYSSGTTGLPKGVELTHRNIMANCLQIDGGSISVVQPTTANNQDVSLCVLPFYHIYGLVVTLLSKLALGLKVVTLPKFKPDTFLDAQKKYKSTTVFLVPPIVLFLASHPDVQPSHLESIETVVSGAAPLVAADVNRLLRKPGSKMGFSQGYGMTEASPVILMQEKGSTNFNSVGSPPANTDVKIVSLEDETKVLGVGEPGELWIRGPQVMKGYYNNPAANEEIFRPGNWMKTGDMAYYDKNEEFYITDRLKELIKVKGYQVAPAELEGILRSHPSLLEAAVVGVPHEFHGETPKAFVVKKSGTSPTSEEIKKFVAEKVASYKKLGDLQFVDSIPKNPSGKILRREVKKMFT